MTTKAYIIKIRWNADSLLADVGVYLPVMHMNNQIRST